MLNEKLLIPHIDLEMKKIYFILIILLAFITALLADSTIDELKQLVNQTQGREKVDLLLQIAKAQLEENLAQSWSADSLALQLAQKARYKKGEQRAFNLAGRIELAKQNYWLAIDYFEKSLNLTSQEDLLTQAVIRVNIAQAYSKLGWTDKSIARLQKAENILIQLKPDSQTIHELTLCYLSWGTIELELGHYEAALSKLLQAMQAGEKIDEPLLEAKIKGNIGRVYQSLLNPALSLEYYRQALEVHQKLENKMEMATVYGNMGTLYSELQDYKRSQEYYELSLQTYKALNNKLGEALALGNLGNLSYFQNDFDQALDYYQESITIFKSIGATVYQAYFLNNIGMMYKETGDFSTAKNYFDQALDISDSLGSLELEAEIYSSFAELFSAQTDYKKALEFHQKEAGLRDSIYAQSSARQIAEMQTKYNTERKERENELLRKDNEIKELEITKKDMQRNSLIIISALVIIMVIFVYKRYRSKKKTAEVLEYKNNLITRQKEDLADTLDELKRTQKQLVESEKMASLGSLVTGVAHEINTPVGIIITAITNLNDRLKTLKEKYSSNKMKKSDLDGFLGYTEKASHLILSNSQRTGELVKSFKKVSVDQSTESKRQFKIKQYINDVLRSLEPKFKSKDISINIDCDDYLVWNSYPGIIAQVITNLIINSLVHGFADRHQGKIDFVIKREAHNLKFVYSDNGRGMSAQVLEKIFDPFFTTNKQSGTGLGMHIIYNLITQKLQGSITAESTEGQGSSFIMEFPFSEGGLSELV